jgi:hypothetical protein
MWLAGSSLNKFGSFQIIKINVLKYRLHLNSGYARMVTCVPTIYPGQ